MKNQKFKTYYAPAERLAPEKIKVQAEWFQNNEVIRSISDAVSKMMVILNPQRQIVYANNQYLKFLKLSSRDAVIGKRPGEAVNCIHAFKTRGGCGTTEFCRTCGAINAILESKKGKQSEKECRIMSFGNNALDLRVTATPYHQNGEEFTIFAISDISSEKRRQALERIFFHDVLNSLGGISGLSSILPEVKDENEMSEIAQSLNRAAENVIEEIQSQRQLTAAENGDLELNYSPTDTLTIIQEVSDLYSRHEVVGDKRISIEKHSEKIPFKTDTVLLRKILGNMVKNALEASMPLSTVTLHVKKNHQHIIFSVHNENFMERNIQLQMFNRSFSTKGAGHGLGTYSMKLFGEKYLKGKVWFTTGREEGTRFFLKLPLDQS